MTTVKWSYNYQWLQMLYNKKKQGIIQKMSDCLSSGSSWKPPFDVNCYCGLKALTYVSKGRYFLQCPKWKERDSCHFFIWVDDVNHNTIELKYQINAFKDDVEKQMDETNKKLCKMEKWMDKGREQMDRMEKRLTGIENRLICLILVIAIAIVGVIIFVMSLLPT